MNDATKHVGHITQTTPPSSPLDTLKALVLRTVDRLEYVLDQIGGGNHDLPEDLIEFVENIRQIQYQALAEHVHVAKNEMLDELRHIHPAGYTYDDCTPVMEHWSDQYGVAVYYPRYSGDRDEQLRWYNEWIAKNRADAEIEVKFGEIIEGVDWGRNGPRES